MNKLKFCYLDSNNGSDDNNGKQVNTAFKTFEAAKQHINDNGIIYLIGKYQFEKNELLLDNKITFIGINPLSEIIYLHKFGDNTCYMKNVCFCKLKISYGDIRNDFHPYMYGDFYNCIVTMSGSLANDYCNFYNCLFIGSVSDISYRSDESSYRVKGSYVNCIFNKKIYTDSSSLRNVIHTRYNFTTDDIDKYLDYTKCYNDTELKGKGSLEFKNNNIGLFGGQYPYLWIKYNYILEQDNKYYSTKLDFYKDGKYKDLGIDNITENVFKDKGFNNLGDITNEVNAIKINGLNINLDNCNLVNFTLDKNTTSIDSLDSNSFDFNSLTCINNKITRCAGNYIAPSINFFTDNLVTLYSQRYYGSEFSIDFNFNNSIQVDLVEMEISGRKAISSTLYGSIDGYNYEKIQQIKSNNSEDSFIYKFNTITKQYKYYRIKQEGGVVSGCGDTACLKYIKCYQRTICNFLISNDSQYSYYDGAMHVIDSDLNIKELFIKYGMNFKYLKANLSSIISSRDHSLQLLMFVDSNCIIKDATLNCEITPFIPINKLRQIGNGNYKILMKEMN